MPNPWDDSLPPRHGKYDSFHLLWFSHGHATFIPIQERLVRLPLTPALWVPLSSWVPVCLGVCTWLLTGDQLKRAWNEPLCNQHKALQGHTKIVLLCSVAWTREDKTFIGRWVLIDENPGINLGNVEIHTFQPCKVFPVYRILWKSLQMQLRRWIVCRMAIY